MGRLTRWEAKVRENPAHSHWFVERFRTMAAEGRDLAGEARLVDAMLPRGARVLDAGCGSGRIGAALIERGHTVVGVDVDPVLIEAARTDHPAGQWLVGDLAELDLPALVHAVRDETVRVRPADIDLTGAEPGDTAPAGTDPTGADLTGVDLGTLGDPFDAVVCAGNVMPFLAPGSAVDVLRAMAAHLTPSGRIAVGFGAGRGYAFDEFFDDVRAAGLRAELRLATWDLRPLTPDAEFLVAVLARGGTGRSTD